MMWKVPWLGLLDFPRPRPRFPISWTMLLYEEFAWDSALGKLAAIRETAGLPKKEKKNHWKNNCYNKKFS